MKHSISEKIKKSRLMIFLLNVECTKEKKNKKRSNETADLNRAYFLVGAC